MPDVQQYDISTNLYEPDYTATFLTLVPAMDICDPDGVIPDGKATLANIKWTLIENEVETLITSSTPGFSIASDGKLTIKRNCQGQNPMTFRFEAEFADPRTGEVHRMMESHMVDCEAVSERPVLSLDTSGMIAYDPIRDGEVTRKVKASLMVGGKEVPAAYREFVWQKRDCDIDNQWADIDGSDLLDYDVSLNADKSELSIKLWLIGHRIDIRCYAKYNPFGNPSSVAIDDRTPKQTFSVTRIVGKLWGLVTKCPTRLKAGVRNITPTLVIKDSKGIVPDVDKVIDVEWRTSTGTASGTVTKSSVIAYGASPTISSSFIDSKFQGKLIPAFGAKDPLGAIRDDDGAIIVDDDGKILLA